MATPRHLVLGGSSGIGFAYAERYAVRGEALWIVARDCERLQQAKQELSSAGAVDVLTSSVDLSDRAARRQLLAEAKQRAPFASVFVGGPGPKPGCKEEVTPADHEHAREICVVYPSDVINEGSSFLPNGGRLLVLSSSAADEPAQGHTFYLSSVYRSKLADVARSASASLQGQGIDICVLAPKVVLTPLSEQFARLKCGDESVRSFLQETFSVDKVPSAREYVVEACFNRE